jgi:isopentenyl-diphosphate Delta-isomerase
MQDELVNIVNDQNSVIGSISKKEAHDKGLLHPVIIAEVINSKGAMMFVKQAPDRQDPGQYVSPVGGHIRSDESEIQALFRECEEELGFTPIKYNFKGKCIYNRTVCGRKENHYFIIYEIYSDQIPTLNTESVGYTYLSKEAIKQKLQHEPEFFGDATHVVFKACYSELLPVTPIYT